IETTLRMSGAYSLTPTGIVHLFFPYFFGTDGNLGRVFAYMGIIPLIFVYIAVRKASNRFIKVFAILAILTFLLSFGNYTFLHAIAYNLIPLYKSFIRPVFIQYLVGFCLAALTGYGIMLSENVSVLLLCIN